MENSQKQSYLTFDLQLNTIFVTANKPWLGLFVMKQDRF